MYPWKDYEIPLPPLHISILIFLMICYISYLAKQSTKNPRSPTLPPGPIGLPVVGYAMFLKPNQIHTQLAQLASTHGPIFKFWAGAQLSVVITSPTLAKQVLRQNDSIFYQRKIPIAAEVASYNGSDLACLPMGPGWISMRKVLMREVISNSSLDRCYPLRRRVVVAAMREVGKEVGKPVDVLELAFKTVVDATVAMVWGSGGGDYDCRREEVREVNKKIMELVGKPNASDVFPLLARFDLQGIEREAREAGRRFDRIVSSVIQNRVESLSTKVAWKEGEVKDLLQILMEIRDSSGSESSLNSITHFKALIQDIVIGGNDSVSSTIEWAMTHLLRSKNSMHKVKQELDRIVGLNNLVEDHHLRSLHYLDAVIKEACRLHHSILQRTSNRPCTIGGYSIPEGTQVLVNAWAIQRDPKVWDRPTEFRPDRFLDDDQRFDYMGSNSSFRFIPFGSGRRVCAGVNLAERMLKYVLASLLHTFEWELVEGAKEVDISDEFNIFIRKKNRLIIVPRIRLSSTKLLA